MSDTLANALAAQRSASVLQGIANPPQFNPLAAQNSAVAAASGVYDLRAKQAKEAAGEAYQGAINPQTGELDANEFRRRLAASGPAAMAAGAELANIQSISSDQLGQSLKKAGWVNAAAGAALQSGDFSDGAMLRLFQTGLANGTLTMPEVQRQMQILPPDAEGRRRWLQEHQDTAASVEQQYQQRFGVPFRQTGPGGQTIGGMQNPRTGAVTGPAQPGLPLGRTPAEAGALVDIKTNPDGTILRGTAQQAQNVAEGRDINDNGPQGSPLGTGRPPPALLNPKAAPAGAPAAAPALTGGIKSGQGTSAAAAATTTGTTSANRFTEIVDQGVKARSQDALLATMLAEAQQIRTGPGLDFVTGLKRTILGAGAQFGSNFGIDTDKLAKLESVIKIGNQLADAQGAGSDARLKVSEGSNPSYHNTPAGLDLIGRQLRGNNDYLRVRQQLAAAYPNKDKIEDFEANIAANLDPRVFQYERLTPEQKADYFKGLTDKDTFIRAHDWATSKKLLGRGG